jgi:tRNA(Ile)-lysidine synthase
MRAFGYLVPEGSTLGVAVSGGSDSLSLLVLATEYATSSGVRVCAVTVDHGLRPEAKDEARTVRQMCDALSVAHDTVHWRRTRDAPPSQDGARRARHALLADWASERGIERVALGHTRDDRLETFLMRARQGSGWHGLAGPMPNTVSPVWPEGRLLKLVRPLLAFGREELRDALGARGLAWVEDPSNEAMRFERVRMRQLIARMAPPARAKAIAVMDRLMRLRASAAEEASAAFATLRLGEDASEVQLGLDLRGSLGAEAWRRLVEALVLAAGGGERAPRREALERLLARIAGGDAQLARGVTLAGARIRLREGGPLIIGRAPPRRSEPPDGRGIGPDWARAEALLAAPDIRVLEV